MEAEMKNTTTISLIDIYIKNENEVINIIN
jgi:hypothetical protein